ncbi:MAG: serine/threonine-protein kinase, partial [Steroidobacteraceae bacterium]
MGLAPGTQLGPYAIEAQVGAGGMGEVYRARDTRLHRTVAVKVLAPAIAADPLFRERFAREAQSISALDHAHICALYDVGEHAGTAFLVMQFLEGETLADRLARGRPTFEEALQIGSEIADALAAAHRKGITHRDLKPGNVMLTKSGVKLLDFGLAKSDGGAVTPATGLPTKQPLTASGTMLGTLYYMAPEQLDGQDADARADIWALGCVLYEMLTGDRPFSGSSPASVIGSILRDTPPPVSQHTPLSPPALDRAITKCLEKSPDRRWQSAADLRDEFRWIGERTLDAPPGMPAAARARRLLVPLFAIAVALAAVTAILMRSPQAPPSSLPVTRFLIDLPAGVTFQGSPTVSPDGLYVVFVARQG